MSLANVLVILQNFLQARNRDLVKLLSRNNKSRKFYLQDFHHFHATYICKKTDILATWTPWKICKTYIQKYVWDLACLILARIVDIRARWACMQIYSTYSKVDLGFAEGRG